MKREAEGTMNNPTSTNKRRRPAKKSTIPPPPLSGTSTPLEAPPPPYTPAPLLAAPKPATPSAAEAKSLGFSGVRFTDFVTSGKISESVAKGIPFEFCTEVQAKTLPLILSGVDLLAQAKTGTGKTVAFLVPSIERLVRGYAIEKGKISILILSPTRVSFFGIEIGGEG